MVEQELDNLLSNTDNVSINNVDEIVGRVSNILIESASTLHMVKQRKKQREPPRKLKKNKPWYNVECRVKSKNFLRCRRRSLLMKNDLFLRAERDRAYRLYKKTVKKQERQYKHEMARRLRELNSKNPKDYWAIINGKKNKPNSNEPNCQAFYELFKNMNKADEEANDAVDSRIGSDNVNAMLDDLITENEVLNCIKKLKNNKACGLDNIANEFLRNATVNMLGVFVKLFNLVLITGKVPKDWVIGVIHPIFKNKGSSADPNNYRGITILSCFGKLFTSILNERLKTYIETLGLLGMEQAGFRNNFSTLDHLFTLYGLIDILLHKKKRLYCAFLDYEKAFDKIHRALLWQKLIDNGISGRLFKIIQNMYSEAKSCVAINNEYSDFFCSEIGVRQGENLSPVLFAMFLSDMKAFLSQDMTGLTTVAGEAKVVGMSEHDIDVLFTLFLLLYADDTVIFSETPDRLQKGLNSIQQYCQIWKLKLNAKKCKVLIFSRGKVRRFPDFLIGNEKLEVVQNFMYLGLKLNYNNKMNVAQRDLYDRASRAMFVLMRKAKSLTLPIDLTIDLFDRTVLPILTYGCEIWGFEMNDIITRLQLRFYKMMLKVRQSTPSLMVFGETGKFPVSVTIKSRMLSFWYSIATNHQTEKLSTLIYKCLLKMYESKTYANKYIKYIHNLLNEMGLSYVWLHQASLGANPLWFKEKVKRCLKDSFLQLWYMHVENDEMFLNYRMFKTSFCVDPYYLLLPYKYMINILKFRITNNNLPVNTLRYTDTPRNERKCEKCTVHDVADEFHYLLVCPIFDSDRKRYLPKYYFIRPNVYKFHALFTSKKRKLLLNLNNFISFINNTFR